MAQAAWVSHMKVEVQFWVDSNRGGMDYADSSRDTPTSETDSTASAHQVTSLTSVPLEQIRWMRVV